MKDEIEKREAVQRKLARVRVRERKLVEMQEQEKQEQEEHLKDEIDILPLKLIESYCSYRKKSGGRNTPLNYHPNLREHTKDLYDIVDLVKLKTLRK